MYLHNSPKTQEAPPSFYGQGDIRDVNNLPEDNSNHVSGLIQTHQVKRLQATGDGCTTS